MDCAILGEGNTSARIDSQTFYVKTSGTELRTIDSSGFVEMSLEPILELLADLPDDPQADSSRAERAYRAALIGSPPHGRPSVETLLHAVCLSQPGVLFTGHTHPTAVNMLTCSEGFPANLQGRMYPDEIVMLGVDSPCIRYVDPGLALGREIKAAIDSHARQHGQAPKVVYLQNHGMIALGESAAEVTYITMAAVKAARTRLGAVLAGGIHVLDIRETAQIANRGDEKYRRSMMKG